jgi:hypothetical protein
MKDLAVTPLTYAEVFRLMSVPLLTYIGTLFPLPLARSETPA